MQSMLTHTQIWAGVDGLAARYGMTASGLARKAGLDPTTFNRSKRIAPDGRQRWPSTESIAKVLHATGASLSEFMDLLPASALLSRSRANSLTLEDIRSVRVGAS
jgi:phage repressor protein C with HTH and peptisase S24 domain